MRTPTFPLVFLAVCLTAILAGCAGAKAGGPDADGDSVKAPPMTLSDFYGFCSTAEVPGGCFSDPVCNAFRKELAVAPDDLPGCLDICRRLGDDLYVKELTNGCEHILDRAQDFCDQFCRRRNVSAAR